MQYPRIIARIGFSSSTQARPASTWPASNAARASGVVRWEPNSLMSAPETNALSPAPVSTTTRTSSSACNARNTVGSAARIGADSALCLAGLLNVTRAMPSSTSQRSCSVPVSVTPTLRCTSSTVTAHSPAAVRTVMTPSIVTGLRITSRATMSRCRTCSSANTSSIEYTGPQGTPAALSTSTHASVVRSASLAATISLSAARFAERFAPLSKRGSRGRSGRPIASQKRWSRRPDGPATFTHPSFERKHPIGTSVGWWLPSCTGTSASMVHRTA